MRTCKPSAGSASRPGGAPSAAASVTAGTATSSRGCGPLNGELKHRLQRTYVDGPLAFSLRDSSLRRASFSMARAMT